MARPWLFQVLCLAALWAKLHLAGAADAEEAPAFLGSELPLRILSVLPSSRRAKESGTHIGGRTTLTVVFSRAVIALGADWSDKGNDGKLAPELLPFSMQACEGQPEFAVPGKIRWTTTAIARFDPDVDWPNDLCFQLVPNLALRTFDGLALDGESLAAAGRWQFKTSPVRMFMSHVQSKQAAKLTGGRWTAGLFGDHSGEVSHECPPDASVYLRFSSDIDHDMTYKALQEANPKLLSGGETHEACGKRCIAVKPRGLEPGQKYSLVFPKGAQYRRIAGLALKDSKVGLSGLVPFTFPFWFEKPPANKWENHKLHARRLHLYLRHGLELQSGEEAQLQKLKGSITLTAQDGQPMDFELRRMDNATLQLQAFQLMPARTYKLEVQSNADVRDGFGQPLSACRMEFQTGDWPDQFLQAEDSPAYFRTSPGGWTVLARGDGNSWCQRSSQMIDSVMQLPVPNLAADAPATMAVAASAGASSVSSGAITERRLSCQHRPFEMRGWPISTLDLPTALAQRYHQMQTFLPTTNMVKVVSPQKNELEALTLDENKLLLGANHTGLFLRELQRSSHSSSKGFVSVASFGAAFVATASGELIVWAMSYSGEPVVGATVKVFRIEKTYQTQLMDITSVISGTTGSDGMVTLKPSGGMTWGEEYATLVAVVEGEGSVAYSEAVPVPDFGTQESSTRAELVTDRSIYRPGDTVHVKGYVRNLKPDGIGYTLPSEGEAAYSVEVVWNRQSRGGAPSKPVKVSTPIVARYGTLSAELKVPASDEEVTYGQTKISLMRTPIPTTGTQGPASWALAYITIADPRPPTVKLNMSSTDKVVLPGAAASVDLEVHAATYTGTPVEGAKVEVSWHLRRGGGFEGGQEDSPMEIKGLVDLSPSSPSDYFIFGPMVSDADESGEASGKLTVVTGIDGKGTAILSLAALLEEVGDNGKPQKPAAEGDQLSLSARWVGPTREVVTAELKNPLPVARSPYVLAVTPNRPVDTEVGTPLPGAAFAVFVDLRNADGESVEGTEVTLSLYEWNGTEPVHEDPMLELTTSSPRNELHEAARRSGLLPSESWGAQVGDPCKVSSDGGKEAKCTSTLTLPAAKKYVVLAKAIDPDGVELVTAFAVGRTPEMWEKRPLQSLDAAVSVHKDKSTYAVGETVELSLVSPFEDATVLVVWGNGEGRKTKQQKLAGGPGETHTLHLPLGSECTFGCNAAVLLSAPDQPRGAMLPIEVPVSPLLDVTLPRMVVNTVYIKVPDTQRTFGEAPLNVFVADILGAHADVFQPGDQAQVTVSAPESARGAEVCVFVVDKAMLDIGGPANPHDVTKLDKRFELTRGDDFRVENTVANLASSDGYRATVNVTLRRAKIDPFPVDFAEWPLRPAGNTPSSVEMTDADYFAAHTADATHFPPGGMGGFGPPMMGIATAAEASMDDGLEMARAAPMPMMMAKSAGGAGMEVEEDKDEAAPAAPPPPPRPAMAELKTSANQKHAGGAGTALGKEAFTRSQFETTPLFKASAVVGEDGKVSVPFKIPDNIATFEVRAYFVDGNGEHKFGHAQTTFISRREVSLMPSVPRVVRPGDRFECGVTVTSHQKAGFTGATGDAITIWASVKGVNSTVGLRTSEASDFEATTVEGEQQVTLSKILVPTHMGGSPEEVVFPFKAPMPLEGGSLGTSTLSFAAHAPGSSNHDPGLQVDGLEANLTVKAQQAPVHVATSLAIIASTTRKAEAAEGIQLPAAMPGSGKLGVTVGVGHLPAVLEDSANLLGRHMDNGQVLVASLAPAAALSAYFRGLSEKPPQGLEEAGAAFRSAVARLPAFTPNPHVGLVWRPEDVYHGRGPPRASVYLNAFAVLVAHMVELFHQPTPGSPGAPGLGGWTPGSLNQLKNSWKKALETELRRQVLDTHYHVVPQCNSDCYKNWMEFALSRAALGYAWTSYDGVVQQELDMSRLFSKEALDSLGTMGLAHAALAYSLHSEPATLPPEAPARLNDIYRRLASQMRVQGRTAYVAASLESPHSAGLEANAAVLLALSRASPQELAQHFADNAGASLVAKLAAYVADGAGAGHSVRFGGGEWMGSREAAVAVFSLASHDQAHGSTKPDLSLEAASGNVDVLKYEAKGAGAAPASVSLAWEQLPLPPKPLRFQVGGRGQVSIAAALTFVPASAPTAGAIYRGLYVEKVVRRMDGATGEATGPPLDLVRLGESVVVTIQVTTPDDLERVTLQDFAAGGLEPVDPKVAGDSAGSSASGGCGGPFGFSWSWWCWPAFAGRQTYADRVKWTSGGSLPAGTHTVSYQAVAATRGVFSLPPAHAFAEDQPELMGLSQAGTLVVVGGGCSGSFAGFSSEEVETDVILQKLKVQPARRLSPKGCAGGCPNGGVCQLATGKCGCYHGLSFVDGDCPAPARSGSDKDAIRLVLQGNGGGSSTGGVAGPGHFQTAAYATCGILLLVIGVLGVLLAQKPRWLSRGGDNARFIPCRDEPYTSMELMERP